MELLEGDIIFFLFFSTFIYVFGCFISKIFYLRESNETMQILKKTQAINTFTIPRIKLSPKVQEAKSYSGGSHWEGTVFSASMSSVLWPALRNSTYTCHQTNTWNKGVLLVFKTRLSHTFLDREGCSFSVLSCFF